MENNNNEIPEDINVHKQIWGKNAEEVVYGTEERAQDDNDHEDDKGRCPICNSRIDEYGYCACGGNLGVS
jgi:hypothetical protein